MKREFIVKTKVFAHDGSAIEPENGQCVECRTRPILPQQAYCAECLRELFSIKCLSCGARLFVFNQAEGVLEEDSPDGNICYRCFHQMNQCPNQPTNHKKKN
jgi:hypothetical protein